MLNYNNPKRFLKNSPKLLNDIFKQSNRNNFLLENLISDLYSDLLRIVPEKIARSASINSKNIFEYFLNYSTEEIKLILKENNYSWSLYYKVYPPYLDDKQKLNYYENSFNGSTNVINLKYFYEKNVKKYYI